MPMLAVLEDEDKLPTWVIDVLPKDQLNASGRIRRRCQLTEISDLRGNGSLLELRGQLLTTPAKTRSAVLIRLRRLDVLSVGVSNGAGSDGVSVLAGHHWLSERLESLDARAKEFLGKPCVPQKGPCDK
jgi:hypothetical protein